MSLTRSVSVPSNVGFRAQIVLALAEGLSTTEIAKDWNTSPPTVVVATMEPPPVETGLTHWSSRELSKRIGISHPEIASVWRNWGLQPHRVESFKFSTDPELKRRSPMWSGCISTRPRTRWCSVSTKNSRSRP